MVGLATVTDLVDTRVKVCVATIFEVVVYVLVYLVDVFVFL